MSAKIIDGKALAEQYLIDVSSEVAAAKACNIYPHLAVVLVGSDPASEIYVHSKQRACERVGIASELIRLSANASMMDFDDCIDELNRRNDVTGILVQLPLPAHIPEWLLDSIDPYKDVDGITDFNVGRLFKDEGCYPPCTPEGCMRLIKSTDINIDGANAVVVGRSDIVGKPMATMLLQHNATVTVCHSHTKDLPSITRNADILVVAAGKPCLITGDMIKPGAVVIDVGMNRVNGKLVGDVDFKSAKEVAGWITPVPGGVGPMTIAALMDNTVGLALENG